MSLPCGCGSDLSFFAESLSLGKLVGVYSAAVTVPEPEKYHVIDENIYIEREKKGKSEKGKQEINCFQLEKKAAFI